MTRQELITKIIAIAHETVRSRNCYFSQDAETQLKELITSGVTYTMRDVDVNEPSQIVKGLFTRRI